MILLWTILIPLLTAALSLALWRRRRLQRVLAVAGAFALLGVSVTILAAVARSGIIVVQVGDWPAPYGITIVADLFSAIMLVLAGIIGAATVVYSLATIDPGRESGGYYPVLHVLLMGISGAFVTGDLFNLFVWFEVMLNSSFVLLALGGERGQMEGAFKYMTLNLMSSGFFLTGVGALYGMTGTLNMADLALQVAARDAGPITVVAMLFLVAFGIKAAVFPMFFWLPASYHTPPVAVSAVFAGLLTKVGVYAMIRMFTLVFVQDIAYTHSIILGLSGATMLTGVLGAVAQNEFRRILSFHIVSQIGYMVMGLGLYTPLALAGSVFYLIHHIIVKANLFLISGIAHRAQGTYQLGSMGGLSRAYPALAVLFLIPAMSLAGLPPLSGFFGKLTLAQAGLETSRYAIVAVSLVAGLLTLFSMTKIWSEAFWKDPPGNPAPRASVPFMMFGPAAALAALTLVISVFAEPFMALSLRAAEELMNPQIYIDAVLGTAP
jgi:multicomponent Na+:H+ antiporter subunit D